MQEKINSEKIINYETNEEIANIITDNFSKHYFLVRHNTYDKKLVFKKSPTPFVKW
jgi:hypothetical protein